MLNNRYIDRLFPFHFVLDKDMRILRKGGSLLKLLPRDDAFSTCFQFVQPGLGIDYTFESIQSFENQTFILRIASNEKKILLKGEFVYHTEEAKLVFCGSPWLRSDDDYTALGLVDSDFALHDSMLDLVHVKKQHALTTQDLLSVNSKLEEAIQKNQDISRFPTENPNPVARFNKDGQLLFCNEAFHENIQPFLTFQDEIQNAFDTGQNITKEINVDGRFFNTMFVPIIDRGYVNLYCAEITAQKLAEKKLQSSESNFRYIVETTNQLIISFNTKLEATWMNQRFAELTGYSSQENLSLYDLFEDAAFKSIVDKLFRSNDEKQHEHIEGKLRIKDGKILEIEGVAYCQTQSDGGISVDFYLNDSSEKKQYLTELEEQRSYYADLFDNLPADVAVLDSNFRFQYLNRSAISDEQLRDWLIGKREIDYFRFRGLPLDKAIDREARFKLMVDEKSRETWEDVYNEGMPNEKVMLRNMLPIFDDKKLVYILAYGVDITQLKKGRDLLNVKNEELEKVNKDLDSFVYSASHDLRAPLLSILGLLDVINRQVQTDEKIAGYLSMIRGVILRLDDTIKDILSYSKNSRVEITSSPIDLKAMIDTIFQGMRHFLPREIRMDIAIQGDCGLHTDEVRIRSLLNNLISNAIKYSRESDAGSWIKINALIEPASFTLTITDNGEGIPADRQAKVFDMFYRASKNSQGSGLGLYICAEIIKKLEGQISLISSPGQGTTFSITLPNHSQ